VATDHNDLDLIITETQESLSVSVYRHMLYNLVHAVR